MTHARPIGLGGVGGGVSESSEADEETEVSGSSEQQDCTDEVVEDRDEKA
jgi:hypothetical protein